MRVQHNAQQTASATRAAAGDDPDEAAVAFVPAKSRADQLGEELVELAESMQHGGDASYDLFSHQHAREMEQVMQRARRLDAESGVVMDAMDDDDDACVSQKNYLVEKAKLRAALHEHEIWRREASNLRTLEAQLLGETRAALDQLLVRSLGENNAAALRID